MATTWLLWQQLLERYIQEPGEEDTAAATHAKCVMCVCVCVHVLLMGEIQVGTLGAHTINQGYGTAPPAGH